MATLWPAAVNRGNDECDACLDIHTSQAVPIICLLLHYTIT